MEGPLLYDYYRSSAAYRVRITLALKSISFGQVPVNLQPGVDDQLKPAYRAINSQGRVPTWVEKDFSLGQSIAILEYLEEVYPHPPLLPRDPQQKARVRQLASLIACDIHPLNNLSVIGYLKQHFDADVAATNAWYGHWVQTGFAALEDLVEADGKYCVGDAPTLADAVLIPQVYNARRFEVPLDDFPGIIAIDANCNKLDAFMRAAPDSQ